MSTAQYLRVSASDLGTSEPAWLSSEALASCAPLVWDVAPSSRIVVLAPHPDDEILAVGGALRFLARELGCAIAIVAVTDGEASHPRSPTRTPRDLSVLRAAERESAFHRLSIPAPEIVRLGVPDGGAERTKDLSDRLREPLAGAALCLAPWERDGHPDHDATGRAAAEVCAQMNIRRFSYPVWAWHWARPDSTDFPWDRARRIALDAESEHAKRSAIEAYVSQIHPLSSAPGDEPILPPPVLARFLRPFEIVLV